MSRHSKNNTAHSIFTYGERQKLKEWGTIRTRVGNDSLKKFELCTLCLSKVVRPVACLKGHLFCKDCLVENLVEQKKEKARELAAWEAAQAREKAKQVSKEQEQKEKLKKTFLETYHAVPLTKERDKYERILEEEEKEKRKVIDSLREHKTDAESKKEWIKTSFWAPEMTPKAEASIGQKPDTRLKCPSHASADHFIRLKDTIPLKLEEGEKGEFRCWVCKDTLSHQKIVTIKQCGHTICLRCIGKEKRCPVCSTKFELKDLIYLEETGTSFSSHNKVESETFKPVFIS